MQNKLVSTGTGLWPSGRASGWPAEDTRFNLQHLHLKDLVVGDMKDPPPETRDSCYHFE